MPVAFTRPKQGGATGTWNINISGQARKVVGDNNAAYPVGALLFSGGGRPDSSPDGDTWIFVDNLGGVSSTDNGTTWGIKHQQASNLIEFYGAGQVKNYINLSGGFYSVGTIQSSAQPAFLAQVSAGSWSYLRLDNGSYLWDIATNSSQKSSALDFRPRGQTNVGPFIETSGRMNFANTGTGYNYTDSAIWIREYRFSGAQSDTWGVAPRLGWHWAGRVAAQIGLASNGTLYEAPYTNTNFYQITFNSGSSREIKHNIAPLSTTEEMNKKIMSLKPVSFIYNEEMAEEGIRYGLIFEDAVEIFPDVCKYDPWQYGGKRINYTDLIPILIAGYQYQENKIKELEEKIEKLIT